MLAQVCEFCGKTTPLNPAPKDAMLYDIGIFPSEGFETETKEEKVLRLDVEGTCMECAAKVKKAILALKKTK